MIPVVVPLIASRVFFAARANQPNGALERLERHLRTPGAQSEVEPFALPGALQGDREFRLEIAAESGNCHPGTGSLGDGQGQISVMGRERIAAVAPDRTGIGDIAVYRVGVEARRIHPLEQDLAVDRLCRDIAGAVGHFDVIIYRVHVDPASGSAQPHRALNRTQRDQTLATGDIYFALDRLDRYGCPDPFHFSVGIHSGQAETDPGGRADPKRDLLRGAVPPLGPNTDAGRAARNLELILIGVGLDPNRVSVPGAHRDLARVGIDGQALTPHRVESGIHLDIGCQRQDTGQEGKQHGRSFQLTGTSAAAWRSRSSLRRIVSARWVLRYRLPESASSARCASAMARSMAARFFSMILTVVESSLPRPSASTRSRSATAAA